MRESKEDLPFREGRWQSVVRRIGNLYNSKKWDHPWMNGYEWNLVAERLLKSSIGKNYDKVYSKWCKKVPDKWRYYWDYYFKEPYADYVLDSQKRIKRGYKRKR